MNIRKMIYDIEKNKEYELDLRTYFLSTMKTKNLHQGNRHGTVKKNTDNI